MIRPTRREPSHHPTPVRAERNGIVYRLWPTRQDAEDVLRRMGEGGEAIEHVSQTGWILQMDNGEWMDAAGVLKSDPNA